MKTYVLSANAGAHFQGGLRYASGEAVNSTANLAKRYPGKFNVAPANVVGTKWPIDIPDGKGDGKPFIRPASRMGAGYQIVNVDGTIVAGCETMVLQKAFAKYRELFLTKKAEKKAAPAPAPEEEEEEEEEVDEQPEAEEEEEEEAEEEEEEEEEKPAKKKKGKKQKKSKK